MVNLSEQVRHCLRRLMVIPSLASLESTTLLSVFPQYGHSIDRSFSRVLCKSDHSQPINATGRLGSSLVIQLGLLYNTSQDAVIIPGASLSSLSMKMPGRKDARTSEKPFLNATINSLLKTLLAYYSRNHAKVVLRNILLLLQIFEAYLLRHLDVKVRLNLIRNLTVCQILDNGKAMLHA